MGAVVSHLAIDGVKDDERGGSDCETACSLANNLSIASRYPRQLFFLLPLSHVADVLSSLCWAGGQRGHSTL